jgi:hypothetical protein
VFPDEHPGANGTGKPKGELKDVDNADRGETPKQPSTDIDQPASSVFAGTSEPAEAAVTTRISARRQAASPAKPGRTAPGQAGRTVRRLLRLIASVIKLIGLVVALILVVHVIFVAGHANPANYLTAFISTWAASLNLGLSNLFTPKDALVAVVIDYGIAAVLWWVVCGLVARILRRL